MVDTIGGKRALITSTAGVVVVLATLTFGYVKGWFGSRPKVTDPVIKEKIEVKDDPKGDVKDDPNKTPHGAEEPEDKPPILRNSAYSFISQVMSQHKKVFTTRSPIVPLPNKIWRDLFPRNTVWTEEDGQARLRFLGPTCKTGFHLFRKSKYVRSNCSREDLESGNNHCVEYGTVDVNEQGCQNVAKFFTHGLQIDPTGTNFTLQYQPDRKLTVVAVTEGSVEVTPVVSWQPFRISDDPPKTVSKGNCLVTRADGAPEVEGVKTMTSVNSAQCAKFFDKPTTTGLDDDAKTKGISGKSAAAASTANRFW